MPHYSDLSPCDYFGPGVGALTAIGWLAPDKEYSRGSSTPEFFRALVQLLVDPWQPVVTAGMQRCSFCRFTGGPAKLQYDGATVLLGAANLFIPTEVSVFVAPSMIAHYIDSHGYSPPDEFKKAVLACPPMRSVAYLRLIRKHGIKSPDPKSVSES